MSADDEFEFIKADVGFYNEIVGYNSVVDYQKEFNALHEQTKVDLQREVEFLYTYFTEDPITPNSSIILDTNNKQICNLVFDIDLYIYESSPPRIVLVCRFSYEITHPTNFNMSHTLLP
jgi:hypothetical protein